MDDVVYADWPVEPNTLDVWLGEWVKRGYTPIPPSPRALLVNGRSVHRYRMEFRGFRGLSDSLGPGPGLVAE